MIKDFTPRLYQETILNTCVNNNTLVVLPTGMGKTNIFLMISAQRLRQYPKSKILLVGPTRPLIDQYMLVFKKHFQIEESKMAIFTGMVSPEKRAGLWKESTIIFSTPQGLENDIITGRINLEEVSLLGFDEAHRAVGDYAYGFVAKQYHKLAKHPRIIGLTASPGADNEKIQEVCTNLFIEAIEVRTNEDADVKPYSQEIKIEWREVELGAELTKVQYFLKRYINERLNKLKKWGVLKRTDLQFINKTDLLAIQQQLRARAASGEKDFVVWTSLSVLAELMKISHALELVETQGVGAAYNYLKKLEEEGKNTKVKAVQNIVKDPDFRSSLYLVEELKRKHELHPKLKELKRIISSEMQNKDAKILVFNQYRDNASEIQKELSEIEGVRGQIFVGQTKKGETGLSQKEQKEIIERFREGELNILVATSIGEEGLDIPRVDLVIFYEPIPSAIRHIQRRGRTGRQEEGRVIVLMAKHTRDEGYRWSAHHKEKQMYKNLDVLKKKIKLYKPEESLSKFMETKPIVYADHREKGSGIIRELVDLGAEIKLQQLEVGDYLASNRVCIELKTTEDFVNSILDGRLLEQLKAMKSQYERPVVIIEGNEDIYSVRNVHPNAIRGMLATIAVSYGIPTINTRNAKDTAALILAIAKREQEETTREFQPHGEKKPMTIKEQQEYIVSALPGVGITLARPLLRKFKTVKKLVNATEEALQKVEKIGPQKAKQIKEVVEKEYEEN
ncbi:MAG: DEAD/DEAH box helicase [Candidatus Woesearchaeota archaeon]